jgi:hypothetical protein
VGLEVPYRATHPLLGSGHYDPISIGSTAHPLIGRSPYNPISIGDAAAATCPTRSYWWLALAAAVGAAAGWQYAKQKKTGGR